MGRKPTAALGAPKKCKHCGQTFPNTPEYYPLAYNRSHPGSLRAVCKACTAVDKHSRYIKRQGKEVAPKVKAVKVAAHPVMVVFGTPTALKRAQTAHWYSELSALDKMAVITEIANRATDAQKRRLHRLVVEAWERAKARRLKKVA